MSARSTQIIGGPSREHAWVDPTLNALQVKVMNPGGGGGGGDVNLVQIGGVPVGAGNALHVQPGTGAVFNTHLDGTVSTANSSTTPLAGNATFTGTFEEVTDFATVTVTVFADVASATDGMKLQWSGDGTNVDREEAITIGAGAAGGRAMALNVRARYFRVVYTNGSGAQATFRLGTVYRPFGTGINNVVLDQSIPGTALAIFTRSVITGETTAGGGSYVNVKVSPSGAVETNANQGTHANLLGQSRIQDRNGSELLSVMNIEAPAALLTSETGIMVLALCTDSPSAAGGTLNILRMNEEGSVYVTVNGGTIGINGAVTINGLIPGTGPTQLGKAEDAVHQTSDVGVMALAVRSDTAAAIAANGDYHPFLVDGSGRLHVNVGASTPGTAATNLGKAEDAAHTTGDVGVMLLAVRNDNDVGFTNANGDYSAIAVNSTGRVKGTTYITSEATGFSLDVRQENSNHAGEDCFGNVPMAKVFAGVGDPTVFDGTWAALSLDGNRMLRCVLENSTSVTGQVSISGHTPGTGATQLGKAEDAAHTSADVGVMALAVRRDTLVSTTSANNDYATLNVNSVGALWVKEYGVATIVLSGSTRGRPIQITGTATGSAVTVHTATTTSGEVDRLYVWLTNTSSSSVTVTIEFGTTGTANELKIIVPANETVLAVDGAVLGGAATDTVKAYASTASVVNAFGRVERLVA